ncbi:MASE3 domain-containing protein [Desulfitobacterium metallireducens]|uniref:Diguanylate cyclase n=1 Tax=Desulfitobacterium metallireducens DSM 15288 TaxID=871968 RepID=W0EB16_9FIRM|nr:MASE3 domain-containing protein [Desulfitobacterium metallireducens]AHF07962.1 diguanylate cyclase [Desulfitobacterium metallireducens DSM 15288]
MKKRLYQTLLLVIIGLATFSLSKYNYLLYHIIIELGISVIGILIFSSSFIARTLVKKNPFTLVGPAFLTTSLMGILHTLTFKGMNLIPGYSANLPTQLWLALSYILVFAFLFSILFFDKSINYSAVLVSTLVISLGLSVLCFTHFFPNCYIEGQGLTLFKKVSEYVIIFLYLLCLLALSRTKKLEVPFYRRMIAVICLFILSDYCFTLYNDVYGIYNFFGHYIRAIAFIIIYISLLNDLILLPYKEILYDSTHDKLTGLYNRNFFFQAMKEQKWTSPGMMVFDINGLKLINDTFGYIEGDKLILKSAEIISTCISKESLVAYTSGGEFSVIVNNADAKRLDRVLKQFNECKNSYNRENPDLPLSFSHGFYINPNSETETDMLNIYHKAFDNMHLQKLLNSNSKCSTIVKTLLKTLETKDITTKKHVERTANLAAVLAIKSGIPENRLNQIVLLAEFHDIGKIGISDKILLKQGPLTHEERLAIQQHSKLGYEIAIASIELAPISDFILKHHEQWDGSGYPFGLKGDQIPLECRIIAIIDAYDAMINDRPYRKALSKDKVIAEITRCSGSQFDPTLAKLFLEIV